MLFLNAKFFALNKGISNPVRFLMAKGFSQKSARLHLSRRVQRLTLKQLEKLCLALHCTPNDILGWQNRGEVLEGQSHPLEQLIPVPEDKIPLDKLANLSAEQRRQVYAMIKAMDRGEG